ncbi:MAG: type VI secretion system protein TssA [Polyangiales bacterium]
MAIAILQKESILAPISDASPCGEDLEYDPEFLSLAKQADPPPRTRLVGPDAPPEEPPWASILDQAIAMCGRTKDLRIAVILVKAAARCHGLGGLAQSLLILRTLIEQFWLPIHPPLDDDGDPTTRINTLRSLCDRQGMLLFLRNIPLVQVAALGSYGLRELAPDPATAPTVDTSKVEAVFANCDLATLQNTVNDLASGIADLHAIESWVTDQVGTYQALSLEELTAVLEQMHRLLQARLATRVASQAGGSDGVGADSGDGAGAVTLGAGAGPRVATGPISSRADVQRTLDLLCAYFDQYEPSSPVPLLLKRARRLTTMSFMDIVRDVAPDGVTQVESIRGPVDSDSE